MPQFQQHRQVFEQMMSGKDTGQQIQTILNMAKSQGIDVNAKIITEAQARQLGLNIPPKG